MLSLLLAFILGQDQTLLLFWKKKVENFFITFIRDPKLHLEKRILMNKTLDKWVSFIVIIKEFKKSEILMNSWSRVQKISQMIFSKEVHFISTISSSQNWNGSENILFRDSKLWWTEENLFHQNKVSFVLGMNFSNNSPSLWKNFHFIKVPNSTSVHSDDSLQNLLRISF